MCSSRRWTKKESDVAMKRLFKIYEELYNAGVKVYSYRLHDVPAVTIEANRKYAIFFNPDSIDSLADETCLVAHEAGHIMTGTTHRVNSPCQLIAQHEEKANRWAIVHVIPYAEYTAALHNGICEVWDLAEHFGVTEVFMRKAIAYYQMREQTN